jgi:hypothetical protein
MITFDDYDLIKRIKIYDPCHLSSDLSGQLAQI